jgi:hypothetical protein
MNVVAVVIIKYEQVVIACTGWYDEATGLIGEDLALFSVLHYGGKAMMGAKAGIFTLWERIEVGVDSDRFCPADGQTVVTIVVERRFLRDWSRCPLTMATERGGCLRRNLAVGPGKSLTYPLVKAADRVDKAGENNEA